MVASINQLLSFLTVGGQVLLVLFILSYLLPSKTRKPLTNFLVKNALVFAFLVALIATLGSLFYSEIAHYEPCKLCWFQRIFMYPQAILLAIAWHKKDTKFSDYSLHLSVIGAVIAGYHYLLQLSLVPSLPCSAVGYSVSCSQRFVLEFGYITIPLMAFTAFLLTILFMAILKTSKKN